MVLFTVPSVSFSLIRFLLSLPALQSRCQLSRLRSLSFCLRFRHKPLTWAGFFRGVSPLASEYLSDTSVPGTRLLKTQPGGSAVTSLTLRHPPPPIATAVACLATYTAGLAAKKRPTCAFKPSF